MEQLEEGFSFRPSDYERLSFLLRFMAKQDSFDDAFITTKVDVYGKDEPWEIYSKGVPTGGEDDCSSYRYFLTKLKKKSNSRYHRDVGKTKGSWKQQDKGKPVRKAEGGAVIGCKKSLSYENKNVDAEVYGHWLMKEYELSHLVIDRAIKFNDRRDWVLCAIKMKKPKSTGYPMATKTVVDFEEPIDIPENLDCANHEKLNMETRVQSTVHPSVMDQLSFIDYLLMSDDLENLDCSQMEITTGEGAKDPMSELDEFLMTLVQGAEYSAMPSNNIATLSPVPAHVEAASYQQQLETGDTTVNKLSFPEELLMSDTYESSRIMGYHCTLNQIEQEIALTTQSNQQQEGAEYCSFEPIAVRHEGQAPSLVQANTQDLEDWIFDAL